MTTASERNRIVVPARPAVSRAAVAATLASAALAGAGYSLASSLPAGHVNVGPTCSETSGPTPATENGRVSSNATRTSFHSGRAVRPRGTACRQCDLELGVQGAVP